MTPSPYSQCRSISIFLFILHGLECSSGIAFPKKLCWRLSDAQEPSTELLLSEDWYHCTIVKNTIYIRTNLISCANVKGTCGKHITRAVMCLPCWCSEANIEKPSHPVSSKWTNQVNRQLSKEIQVEAWELVQWVRAQAALIEDGSLVPSTYKLKTACSFRDPMHSLLTSVGNCTYIHITTHKTHVHIQI